MSNTNTENTAPNNEPENDGFDPLAPESEAAQEAETQDGASTALSAMQAELDQLKDQMMRALAEAENTRQRARREREDASKFAIANFARDLLAVSDNLRRALDAVPADLQQADERIGTIMQGIEATERELLKTFEKNGIRKMDPTGQPFNPNFHEVMFEAPGTGQPSGTIIQVIETGYVLNDRLLRPARVGVAKDNGGAPAVHSVDTQAYPPYACKNPSHRAAAINSPPPMRPSSTV